MNEIEINSNFQPIIINLKNQTQMASRGSSQDPPGRLKVSFQDPSQRLNPSNDPSQRLNNNSTAQRTLSFGTNVNTDLQNNRQIREAQANYEDQIAALESDKVSLMKRLNMVLSELESATHEKAAIGLRVADQERQAEELKRKLEEAASLKQAVNRNLQDELRYERELNEKMRDEISRFEAEKDSIIGRLRDAEALTNEIQRETTQIKQNLQRKTEELKRLEREHESNMDRLRELTTQLESLRGQEMHGKGEKRRLEEELADLTREKEGLIRRMNDLNARYDDYVQTMERERQEIVRANRNHVKLLTAKLVYQMLNEMVKKRRKDGLQAMQSCSSQLKRVESIVQRFVRVLSDQHTEAQRWFLRLWYRNSMDFTNENYKKLNLIDFNVAKRRKISFFYAWRTAYIRRKQVYESKNHAVVKLSKIARNSQDLNLRNKLCRWRDFVELRQYQQEAMDAVLTRHQRREQRFAFVRWLALVKAEQQSVRYENMSNLVTELSFKQRVFLALRHACQVSRTERTTEKFQDWKTRCLATRARKYYIRKKIMVERLQGVRAERLVKQCFDAIRYCNVLEKYEATKAKLGEEIPIREELERKRDTMIKLHRNKDKYNMLRKWCIRVSDAKYRALMVWKENISYWKRTMNRVNLRVTELHRRNLSTAFLRWREGADRLRVVELLGVTEDLMNENQELRNNLQACHNEQEDLAQQKFRQQALKIERLRNIINRSQMHKRLAQWAENSWFISCLDDGLWKATKTIERRRLKNAFDKYKQQVKEVKREEFINHKVDWFIGVHNKKLSANVYDAWVYAIKRFKKGKTFLIRSIIGVDRLIANDAFNNWKSAHFTARRDVYHENIAELQRRQKAHENQIVALNKQIQVNDSTQHHLQSKLLTQSHKIIANFISRFIHSSQARGFYTWLETLKEFKTRRRFLRSTVQYWIKNNQARAFRHWAQSTLSEKERELSTFLADKEHERKDLQRQKDHEEIQQSKVIEQMTNEYQHAVQVKEQLKSNYEKALTTHISRVHNNVYVNRRRNIFCIWADYIKKEKNAVNLIGAIARRQMRMEVFTRIRLVARERFLEANAERIMTNLFRLMKQNVLTRSFSKWRVRSYTEVVREMQLRREQLKQTIERHRYEAEVMEAHKQAKAMRILKQRKQREVTNAWIQMAKVMKAIRVKEQVAKENLAYMQVKWATQRWQSRVKLTQYLRRKNFTALNTYRTRTLLNCYRQWHLRAQLTKIFVSKTFKFGRRLQCLQLADGFSQILHFSKSFKERDRERREHAVQSSFKILARLLKKKVSESFLSLRLRAHKKNFKQEHFARMLRHVLSSRMRHFFGKWRHNSDRMRVAETVNTEGEVVLERNEVRRHVKALRDFLGTQGYTPDDIEGYLSKKSEQQKSQMHRAVVGLFFRNSDFEIIPKAFNQWRRWVQQRRLCKQWARYTVNAMNHPLHWAFRKWKLSEEDAREKLKTVLKKDLVKKIIDDELAIGSAQHRLERMDEQIENLGIQRDSLLQHYIAGQRLALALGKNNHMRTLFRAFIKWKKETRDYEQYLLMQQLDRTNLMIQDLMNHVGKLENIHRGLVSENEELRQAAMDGIEIAKAVQDLTRERETLSQDLQERASTIKRLIEDNNTLAYRLSVAQKEAEQLEDLNREAMGGGGGVPERDRY